MRSIGRISPCSAADCRLAHDAHRHIACRFIGWGAAAQAQNITEFQVPTAGSGPAAITLGPDGNLWFTENLRDNIGRITPSGVFTEFALIFQARPDRHHRRSRRQSLVHRERYR